MSEANHVKSQISKPNTISSLSSQSRSSTTTGDQQGQQKPNNDENNNKNNNNKSNTINFQSKPTIDLIKKRAKIDIKRERKAAKTLGVIMTCFIVCWLPFFLMQILFSICSDCALTKFLQNGPLVTVLTWSGYLNSLLNPVIYTIFSPDFRNAFAKILFGKYRHVKN